MDSLPTWEVAMNKEELSEQWDKVIADLNKAIETTKGVKAAHRKQLIAELSRALEPRAEQFIKRLQAIIAWDAPEARPSKIAEAIEEVLE
jgi:hypothetical protein